MLLILNNSIQSWVLFGYHCVIRVAEIGDRDNFSTILNGFIQAGLRGFAVAAGVLCQVSEVRPALAASTLPKLPSLVARAQSHLFPQLTKLILLRCLLQG